MAWVSTKEAARMLGVHVGTLWRWVGELPPPPEVAVKLNDSVWRWNPDAAVLRSWIANRRVGR